MRIDGYNGSLYPHQALSGTVPDAETQNNTEDVTGKKEKNAETTDLVRAGVVVEISSLKQKGEVQMPNPEQKESIWIQFGKLAKKDWQELCAWVKKMLEKGKELVRKGRLFVKSLSEETEDMTGKVGNPTLLEQRKAETGVAPLTWQEIFKLRIKVFFEAVTGFLAKHLPMNNGGFSGTKEEKREKELEGKEKTGKKQNFHPKGNPSDMSESTFDQRG